MKLQGMDIFDSIAESEHKAVTDEEYYSHCSDPSFEPLIQDMYNRTKAACSKFNFECFRKFAVIYIKTPYDIWCFEAKRGKLHLKHREKESITNTRKEFHTHFKEQISVEELVQYIHEHTQAKFTNEFVEFSTMIGRTDKN